MKQTKPETLAERLWAWAKLAWRQFDLAKGLGPLLTAAAACAFWLAFVYLLVEGLFFPHLTDKNSVTEIARWWEYLKTWIPGLIGGGGLVGSLYKLARTATPRLDAKLNRYLQRPDYANKLSFLTSFHEDFAGYVETHIRARQRVFVLVDDLDRCDPLQAAGLLKAINLMIPDGLPLVFIIAIDRLKVAAGIAAGQEKLLPFILEDRAQSNGAPIDRGAAIAYGYEFLEKFVQLPFRLPRMGPQNVARFIASLVGKAEAPPTASAGTAPNSAPLRDVATDSPLVSGVLSDVAPLLNFNPRRLKQFLNLFRLRHYVLESTGRLRTGEPTLAQLGKVVALEIRWPRLVEDILRRPSLLQALERAATDSGPVGASETLVDALATRPTRPTPDVHWMGDELLLNFLRSGSEADRIGALDLGAILGAAPNALELEKSAYAVQTATVTMVVNRADGSVEPPITVGSSDNNDG
ncbi:MAG: P-loop NTPase fold protein [Polyangiaceae bacterium]